jgi:Zn-dependent peptidase ImmA (M78 family)
VGKLRKGFSGEAESIAEGVRQELGIGNIVRLDPHRLAARLEVPILSLGQLARIGSGLPGLDEAVAILKGSEQSALSAVTVFAGTRRMIVYNDEHSPARQASDLCHEVAHGLLLHQPTLALDERGCRAWDTTIENEADYLGGALLIPGKAARWVAKCGMTADAAAECFGCSPEMVNWRLNESGARRLMKVT